MKENEERRRRNQSLLDVPKESEIQNKLFLLESKMESQE
jgi:hypothetical protein